MTEICDAVFAAQRGKIDIRTAYARVRGVYDALLVDEDSSPMAIAIASVASGALASDLGTAAPPVPLPLQSQTVTSAWLAASSPAVSSEAPLGAPEVPSSEA